MKAFTVYQLGTIRFVTGDEIRVSVLLLFLHSAPGPSSYDLFDALRAKAPRRRPSQKRAS